MLDNIVFAYYVYKTLASNGFLFSLFKCSCHIICVNNVHMGNITSQCTSNVVLEKLQRVAIRFLLS